MCAGGERDRADVGAVSVVVSSADCSSLAKGVVFFLPLFISTARKPPSCVLQTGRVSRSGRVPKWGRGSGDPIGRLVGAFLFSAPPVSASRVSTVVFLLERFDSGIRSSRFVYFCVLLVCFLFRIFSCPLCACVCVSFSLIHSVFFICLFRLDRFVGEPKALVVVVKASELFPAFVVCLFLLHFIRSPICFAPVKTKLTNHKKTDKNKRRTTCTTRLNH